ncbi:hypothetical protein QSU92_05940 [Microbacterium sp. ET2]|jgi:hypothetical protein|uniref:hypothetical protein n=1 Tax=Microbacterium albipurpureum TaxID=3050384 RepID=UPI00259CD0D7|nr:hypothetical protein [Microbacterium sp. ET2 (Ac-2212)]WJL96713.1 hypothetical protein QSU92_05940 [Microbacterium sp. ET2 (Ac-2212)]
MTEATKPQTVDEALRQFTDMMAADGYVLSWEPSDPQRIVVRIDATEGACADCLVPVNVMEAIMAKALEPTPYALDRVILPADAAH